MADIVLSLLFGVAIGFALGMTGGGGSIFAIPLLVYGLGVDPHKATGISLAAVGTTALFGFFGRLKSKLVEYKVGLFFVLAGLIGVPLGDRLAEQLSDELLMGILACLMFVVAVRMWWKSMQHRKDDGDGKSDGQQTVCRRDADGYLVIDIRTATLLSVVGLVTGILTGLLGVGGGFLIVPALVFFTDMEIHRAVGTSLLVIALNSVTGVMTKIYYGLLGPEQIQIVALFVLGGIAGMKMGTVVGKRMSANRLQKVFAVAIIVVALFIVMENYLLPEKKPEKKPPSVSVQISGGQFHPTH